LSISISIAFTHLTWLVQQHSLHVLSVDYVFIQPLTLKMFDEP